MTYAMTSVHKEGANPGRPKGKNPNVIIFRMDDVLTFPARDENGVKSAISENLTFKTGATAIEIYMTPSTIKRYDTAEGDPDAKGWIQNFEGEHPGDGSGINEFLENNVNENLGVCSFRGEFQNVRLQGTPEEPLQFEVEEKDDNEGLKKTLKFKSIMRGPKTMHYEGTEPVLDTAASGAG